MGARLLDAVKYYLTRVGARLSWKWIHQLNALTNYITVGHWMAYRGYDFPERVRTREQVYDAILRDVANRQVLYLEFGVFQGESMRYWSKHLKHPGSVLHGFDSFEGLPETGIAWQKGAFDTGGRIPKIDDPRVRFFKGWFEETLSNYDVPPHEVLIINFDADLYSSTVTVFDRLKPHIVKGSWLYFDELDQIEHEPRAFEKFANETGLKFTAVSATRSLARACFRCIGGETAPR